MKIIEVNTKSKVSYKKQDFQKEMIEWLQRKRRWGRSLTGSEIETLLKKCNIEKKACPRKALCFLLKRTKVLVCKIRGLEK